jgi:hypothetical protein
LQAQRGVGSQQLGHAAVVMGSGLDDPQLVFGDRSAELGSQARTSATLRVSQQVTDLGDRQRRDNQTGPVLPQDPAQRLWSRSAILNAATSGPYRTRSR